MTLYLVDSMIDSIVTPSPTPMLLLRGKPAIMTTLCHVPGGVSLLRRPLPTETVNTILNPMIDISYCAYHLHSSLKLGDLILRCRDHEIVCGVKEKESIIVQSGVGEMGRENPERDERLTSSSSS